MQQTIDGYQFGLVGAIEPMRGEDGTIKEEMPQGRYRNGASLALNKYGQGPFCRFRVARGWRQAGLYVISLGRAVVYVGECQDLEARYGPDGYGSISPRNCFKGGQETNCRVNRLILDAAKEDTTLTLWFCPVDGGKEARVAVEARFVASLKPAWNR